MGGTTSGTPARMGRPPLPPALQRRHHIRVPVTGAEYERIAAQAKARGLTLAAYLRGLALEDGKTVGSGRKRPGAQKR